MKAVFDGTLETVVPALPSGLRIWRLLNTPGERK